MSTATLREGTPRARPGAPGGTDWISLAEAARILGAHPASVKNAALCGSIRYRSIAGMRTRYSRQDVLRLAS